LLGEILKTPHLAERLLAVLRPNTLELPHPEKQKAAGSRRSGRRHP
jgi:hypothetical protein